MPEEYLTSLDDASQILCFLLFTLEKLIVLNLIILSEFISCIYKINMRWNENCDQEIRQVKVP